MPKQPRRTFTSEFRAQMVQLFENGKSRATIVEEYDLTASALDRWIKQSQATGSFQEKDNRSPEENELTAMRKELQRLRMENGRCRTSYYNPSYTKKARFKGLVLRN
ncbi:transposase [Paenibacillus amylolyticus]|uniref:Transposase n=1 Tax=Paenibacillus amylolyticus TaxID=1451 RepID=A0AAP5H6R0_PAEAM|nr:transposase [Paenibacillus amylolyticus]MDR6726220.1 transposase [Paenibacillus amylolyticus]